MIVALIEGALVEAATRIVSSHYRTLYRDYEWDAAWIVLAVCARWRYGEA